jgi:tetratricopeptide (TPR) repeat protein
MKSVRVGSAVPPGKRLAFRPDSAGPFANSFLGDRAVSTNQPIRTPRILDLYEKYLDNQDSVAFVNEVSLHYTQGTLQRLTLSGMREIRRAAVLALGFIGDYQSNHTLGRALLDDDRTVRTLAENGVRSVWSRMGSEKERQEIAIITRLNAAQQYKEVIRRATKLTESSPWFSEAWHQRGAAFFALGRFADAIRDCHEALEINPYHFVAATCMGQAYLELENPVSALESFRRALRLNPDLEGVRVQVVKLTRMVEDR